MFGISDSSDPNRKGSAKDFAVLLGQASAGRVLRGEDFLHLLSGYVQANLSELRTGILRLSLNTPCLSYLSSLVKKSRSARSNRSRHVIDDNAEQVAAKNRRIVLKLTVMLMELVHLKFYPRRKMVKKMSMPLKIKCNVKMFANLRMLEIHGATLRLGKYFLSKRPFRGIVHRRFYRPLSKHNSFEPDKVRIRHQTTVVQLQVRCRLS